MLAPQSRRRESKKWCLACERSARGSPGSSARELSSHRTPHTALPLIRYLRGTEEQEAAEPAVLRQGSSSSGSGAALRTTTQVLAVVATCSVMQGASLAFALAFSTRFYGGMVMKTLMVCRAHAAPSLEPQPQPPRRHRDAQGRARRTPSPSPDPKPSQVPLGLAKSSAALALLLTVSAYVLDISYWPSKVYRRAAALTVGVFLVLAALCAAEKEPGLPIGLYIVGVPG